MEDEKRLRWCFTQKRGIKLIEPNNNLAQEYFKNAEETLRLANVTKENNSNMWLATQKYYLQYLGAYAILMKLGIKCEIHECTIQVIKFLEAKGFIGFSFADALDNDKQLRIDNQYYLKNISVNFNSDALSEFLLSVKKFIDTISSSKIKIIRKSLKSYLL